MINPGYKIDKSTKIPSKLIWVSSYYPYFKPNSYWHNIDLCGFQEHHYSDHDHWHELVKRLNAPPSAGLLCVTNLAHTDCDLHLFGFSRLASNKKNDICDHPTRSKSDNHYGDNHRKSGRHNWPLESELLNELQSRVTFY